MPGIGSDDAQRLGGCREQDAIDDGLIVERTMSKVCKSGGEGTFAERHGNGEVAPSAVIPALAP
jgi:hypothetical protein